MSQHCQAPHQVHVGRHQQREAERHPPTLRQRSRLFARIALPRRRVRGGFLLNCIPLYPACILMYPRKYMYFTYPSVSLGVHMYPVDVIRIHM